MTKIETGAESIIHITGWARLTDDSKTMDEAEAEILADGGTILERDDERRMFKFMDSAGGT